MSAVIMAMSLLAAALLQALAPSHALLGHGKPPALLSVTLYYALNRDRHLAILAAGLSGFLQDALAQTPLGCSSAVYCAAAWLAGRYRGLVVPEAWVTPVVFGAVAGGLAPLPLWLMLARAGRLGWGLGGQGLRMLGSAALCALTTLLAFRVLAAVERGVGAVTVKEDAHEIGTPDA